MTMRFAVNKLAAAADVFLWEFYSFMTTASPSGPGWSSVGESNGTSGGMGTTGLFSSSSDLTSSNAWFVLESPDTNRQILFERKVGGSAATGEMRLHYDRLAAYTGGSSTTLPTSSSSQAVYTSTTWIYGGSGYYQFGADDASPYGWWFFGYISANDYGCGAFIPINNGVSGDVDPYVLFGSNTGFLSSTLDVESTSETTSSVKAWDPTGTTWSSAPANTYVKGSDYFPGGCNLYAAAIGVPILFSARTITTNGTFKGMSYFMRWGNQGSSKDIIDSGSYVISEHVFLDWDGATTPL